MTFTAYQCLADPRTALTNLHAWGAFLTGSTGKHVCSDKQATWLPPHTMHSGVVPVPRFNALDSSAVLGAFLWFKDFHVAYHQ